MPRPNRQEKNRLEQRRQQKAKLRADGAGREQRTADQVKQLVDAALTRTRRDALPNLPDLIEQLQEARAIALACYPPQTGPAIASTMAQAKLLGFVVDRSAVAVGTPQQFQVAKSEADVLEDLRERIGSAGAEQFRLAVQIMKEAYAGDDTRQIDGHVEDGDELEGD
jgi:hypothetical protein